MTEVRVSVTKLHTYQRFAKGSHKPNPHEIKVYCMCTVQYKIRYDKL